MQGLKGEMGPFGPPGAPGDKGQQGKAHISVMILNVLTIKCVQVITERKAHLDLKVGKVNQGHLETQDLKEKEFVKLEHPNGAY